MTLFTHDEIEVMAEKLVPRGFGRNKKKLEWIQAFLFAQTFLDGLNAPEDIYDKIAEKASNVDEFALGQVVSDEGQAP